MPLSRLMTGSGRTVAPTEPPDIKKQVKSLKHINVVSYSTPSVGGHGKSDDAFFTRSMPLPSLFSKEILFPSQGWQIG